MNLYALRVEEAVGKVLSHDITKIVKGEYKGAPYKKGHVIQQEDILELLKLGKENVYVLELEPGDTHEDEAGVRLGKAVAGPGVTWCGHKESRVNLHADCSGLLKINVPALEAINELPDVILSTLPNNSVVSMGTMLAGTKVIPLVVPEETIVAAEKICLESGPVIQVVPFGQFKVGVIITGNEIYKKRVRDGFAPVITEKVESFGSRVIALEYVPDDAESTARIINKMISGGANIIFVTGGMSVDPDDVTPNAIRLSGAAGEKVTKKDIVALAHGGLCRSCAQCGYPNCTFGKGTN